LLGDAAPSRWRSRDRDIAAHLTPDIASPSASTVTLFPAARVISPKNGRVLEVFTDQPALQLYCCEALSDTMKGKSGRTHGLRSALCLEGQHFPDSPNRPQFPSTVLRPGETRRHTCVYKTSVE